MKLIDYLLAFQKKLANSVARFVIALWSRQTGKGFTTSFIASRGAMTEPRSKWLIVAPTERQSLETLDKCKDWIKAANLSAAESEEEFDALEKGAKVKAKVIVLSNGSKIYALPGKPASLRGFTGYLIIDEFARGPEGGLEGRLRRHRQPDGVHQARHHHLYAERPGRHVPQARGRKLPEP